MPPDEKIIQIQLGTDSEGDTIVVLTTSGRIFTRFINGPAAPDWTEITLPDFN